MFALPPAVGVFADELQEYKGARGSSIDESTTKKSSSTGAGISAVQLLKPKRKALANITNAKSSVAGSTATTKTTALQEASEPSVELPSAAVSADGHLETPEKLAGPSGADQEVLVTKSDDNQLEDRVQKILRAIEGAPEDGICDISRDDDDVLQCIWESSPEGQVPLDLLSTLPDMQAPNFLDLLE